jgi:hypothetical protein
MSGEGAHLELHRPRRGDAAGDALVRPHRLLRAVGLAERLGARQRSLYPPALVGRDAACEEAGVHAQTRREPLHRLARRARLAPLDLADVLLGEALARELALRETGGDSETPHPFPELHRPWPWPGALSTRGMHSFRHGLLGLHSVADTSLSCKSSRGDIAYNGHV